jgi:hypothetical protein
MTSETEMDQDEITQSDLELLARCREYNLDVEKLDRMAAICERQHLRIQEYKAALAEQGKKLAGTEVRLRDAEAQLRQEAVLRPSLEVLQRMANGLDPFDRGRFQAAMAALPHETPKLSATISAVGSMENIGDRLDRARRQQIEASGLRVVEGDPAA